MIIAVRRMKTDNALVNIKGNNGCNINITLGESDELSPLNIYKGESDILTLEEAFSDRMGLSCMVLNNNVLPKQLRDDFEIKPKIVDDKVEYYTKPKTEDAYKKYPLKMNFSMEFPNIDEANKFRDGGIEKLQQVANKTRKPVKIPYIKNMKEFLGEYENPTSYVNKHGWEGSELYLMPQPLPPAQTYTIEVFNQFSTFKINVTLRLTDTLDDEVVLSNSEFIDEPFNVEFRLSRINKQTDMDEMVESKFNLTISLRKTFIKDCTYNLELVKYRFLANDKRNTIIIKNITNDQEVFRFNNCGTVDYQEKDDAFFNKVIDVLEKIIYISKIKDIKIDYDIENFLKNEEYINLLISEIKNNNYKIDKKTYWTVESNEINENELYEQNGTISVLTTFLDFNLFGQTIKLKKHRVILKDCKILEIEEVEGIKYIKLEVNNLLFELL